MLYWRSGAEAGEATHGMRRLTVILLLLSLVAGLGGLAGCGGSMLRDDYMGKSVLQPDQLSQPVDRDERGEPILE